MTAGALTRGALRARPDAGDANVLVLCLGLGLVFFPVMMLLTSVAAWEQRAVDAQDLARTGARALVSAADWADGEASAAADIGAEAAGDGLSPADFQVGFGGALVPGGAVSVSVDIVVPIGVLPGLGDLGVRHYTAVSVQHVDTYRGTSG